MMMRSLPIVALLWSVVAGYSVAQPDVRVEPPADLHGPRTLEATTATAVVRDYLQSWRSMDTALQHNRADLLDADFVGTAREKLAKTIQDQAALGLAAQYQDVSHDLQIVFYSPEGLSVELTDSVDYDVQVLDHDKAIAHRRMHARYVVVLTPTESRWKVRVFQAQG